MAKDKKMTPWTRHVQKTFEEGRKQNKEYKLRDAMKAASASWKSMSKSQKGGENTNSEDMSSGEMSSEEMSTPSMGGGKKMRMSKSMKTTKKARKTRRSRAGKRSRKARKQ